MTGAVFDVDDLFGKIILQLTAYAKYRRVIYQLRSDVLQRLYKGVFVVRLRQIPGDLKLHRPPQILLLGVARKYHDRHWDAGSSDLFNDLKPIHMRHADIKNQRVVRAAHRLIKRLQPVLNPHYFAEKQL